MEGEGVEPPVSPAEQQQVVTVERDHEVQDEAGNSQPKCGMYLQAFCNGLSQTLDPYRDDLVELEKKALADPHFTLSGVFCHVDKYSELFPVLVSITEEVT
uniref:Gamma tubulin complex component protein N-terminal domain-containing protein n=1 Tax=Timema tahoe TaxID=61484 RepID=A0A7R9NW20_9NEOP|nr:unnamed protein product [Timema tahoe]